MKNYEALIIINSSSEDDVKRTIAFIADNLVKAKAKVIKEENWGKKNIPYRVKKQKEGVYYKIEFSMDPAYVKELKNLLNLNTSILRLFLVKKD